MPNMDEVVKRLEAQIKYTQDACAVYAYARVSDLRLLIEEREQDKAEISRLNFANQNVHDWRDKAAREASQLRDKVAEQDKEIQHYLQILEDIRINALDETGSRFASFILAKTHDDRIKRPFG